jgi:hypothetical protein
MLVYIQQPNVIRVCLFIVFSSSFHRLFIVFSSSFHRLFIVFSSSFHRLFIVLSVLKVTEYTTTYHNVSQHVSYRFHVPEDIVHTSRCFHHCFAFPDFLLVQRI